MLVDLSKIRGVLHSVQIVGFSVQNLQLELQGVQIPLTSTYNWLVQEALQRLFSSLVKVLGLPEVSNSAQDKQVTASVQVLQGYTQLSHLLLAVFP